MMVDPVTCLAH